MNLTTSSYVEVDLNPDASAVVFRSAMGGVWRALAARTHTAGRHRRAATRRIQESSARIVYARRPRAKGIKGCAARSALHRRDHGERVPASHDVDREPGPPEGYDLVGKARVVVLPRPRAQVLARDRGGVHLFKVRQPGRTAGHGK